MVGDLFGRLRGARERFEDLPPVDLDGWLADQGRSFLQTTDQQISRLGLPDFMASTQQKIQGLGGDLGGMYTDLQQGLNSLPSDTQTASTDFLQSTGDRISGLNADLQQGLENLRQYRPVPPPATPPAPIGQEALGALGRGAQSVFGELGSDLGRMGPQLGSQLQGSADRTGQELQGLQGGLDALTLQGPDQSAQRQAYEQHAADLARQRGVFDEQLSPVSQAVGNLPQLPADLAAGTRSVFDQLGSDWQGQTGRMGSQLAERYPRFAALGEDQDGAPPVDRFDFRSIPDATFGALSGAGGALADTLGDLANDPTLDPQSRGAMQSARQRVLEQGEAFGGDQGLVNKVRGSVEAVRRAQAQGDTAGAQAQSAGLLANVILGTAQALGAPLDVIGGGIAGGAVGGEHNLAAESGLNTWLSQRGLPGVQPDTLALGGLANPAALGGTALQAVAPQGAVDDLTKILFGVVGEVGRPVVSAFMREMGPARIRQALVTGTEALGALFDDYVARAAEAVPGGAEGPLGRLIGEEGGGMRLPFARRAAPPALHGSVPSLQAIANPSTDAERAFNNQLLISQGQEAAARTPQGPAKLAKDDALATFDRAWSAFRENWTDENARLSDVQGVIEQRLGRALTPDEDVELQRRLYAGRAGSADRRIETGIVQPLKGLSEGDVKDAEAVLEDLDNVGRAKAVANAATARAAGEEVGPVAGETGLRTTNQSLRMRQQSLNRALAAQQTADDAYRQAQADLRRVRAEGRREVRGSQGRGRPRRQRTPAEQQRVEQEAQQQLDAARQATVDARAAARDAAKAANVNLSKVTRADLSRMRQEAEVEARRLAEEAQLAEGAATKGAEAQAGRRYSGGVTGVDYGDQASWDALEMRVRARLGANATPAEVQAGVQKVRTAVEALQAHSRALRERLHDAGVIPDELYQQWERDFPNYLRTSILERMDQEAATGVAQGAQRFTVNSLVSGGQNLGARMTEAGTHALREQPINSLVRMTYAAETLARRNEIAQTLERLVQFDPKGATADLAARFRPLAAGEAAKPGEAVFSVYKDGEPVRYAVDKRFAGLFELPASEARRTLQAVGKWTGKNAVQSALTTYNPSFVALNAMRDYWVYLRREARTPLEAARATGDLLRAYGDVAAERAPGLKRVLPKGWAARSEADLGEAARLGGSQEASYSRLTPQEQRNRMLNDPRVANRGRLVTSVAQAADAITKYSGLQGLGNTIREAGGVVETAPRLAAYRRALARGKTPQEAALAMRDVTLDFSRGGRLARDFNAVIPFFNAAIQGSARFLGDDLVNRKASTALQASTLLGAKLALDQYNRQYGAEYDDVPDYLKDSGIVFMLPGDVRAEQRADGQRVPGGRNFLYFPLPQDMGALLRVGSQAVRRATGTGGAAPLGTGEGVLGMAGDLLTAASPVNLEGGSLLPPAAKQVLEQATNKDLFRDRPVVSDALLARPPEDQYTPQTSALGRVAGALGEATGLPISPARTDYAVTGLLGGTGRQLLGASDLVARGLGREDLASRPYSTPEEVDPLDVARGVPVAGGLVGAVARQSGGQLDANQRADLERRITDAQREARRRLESIPGYQRLPEAQRASLLQKEQDGIRRNYEKQARDLAALDQARRAQAQR